MPLKVSVHFSLSSRKLNLASMRRNQSNSSCCSGAVILQAIVHVCVCVCVCACVNVLVSTSRRREGANGGAMGMHGVH